MKKKRPYHYSASEYLPSAALSKNSLTQKKYQNIKNKKGIPKEIPQRHFPEDEIKLRFAEKP
jgi:hypothetical protein